MRRILIKHLSIVGQPNATTFSQAFANEISVIRAKFVSLRVTVGALTADLVIS